MTEAWRTLPLRELTTKIGSGATPRGGAKVYSDEGIAFIRSQNVFSSGLNQEGLVHISVDAAKQLDGVTVSEGDVLINITGESVGRCCRVPSSILPARVSQHVSIIRTKPNELDSVFLVGVLQSSKLQAKLHQLSSSGATRRALTKAHLENLEIVSPPFEEQRRIASMLGSLEELIQANRRLAVSCDSILQELWVRDFYRRERSLVIGDVAEVSLGGTPSRARKDFWNGTIPWINSGKVNEFRIMEPSQHITELGFESSSTKLLRRGTTVIAITGATLGKVSRLEIEACANQSVVGVSAASEINDYLYFSIRNNISALTAGATGGAQQHINKNDVEQLRIQEPDPEALASWNLFAAPLLGTISDCLLDNEVLIRVRDELLPKLLSGAVRVGAIT